MAAPYAVPEVPVAVAMYTCLKEKVVLITGASAGIGAAAAVNFARNGAKVALHGRNINGLEKVKEFCMKEGISKDKLFSVDGDLKIPENCEKIVKETVKHFGKLDILINNAGAGSANSYETGKPENIDEMYKNNARSTYHVTQVAMPYLKQSKGNIIVVSSVAAYTPIAAFFDYGMSKAMLDMFAKSLALDVATSGVRVNTINPGGVRTDVLRFLHKDDQTMEKEERKKVENAGWNNITQIHPMGRIGWPDEVAQLILFLASDVAAFVTGHSFVVDGGFSLTSAANAISADTMAQK